jgi:hypothetical protein
VVPKQVLTPDGKLQHFSKVEDYDKKPTGWYFNPDEKKGMIFIKTSKLSAGSDMTITLKY